MQKEIDIFVSYKSEERGLADFYRTAFIAEGYSVVSDVELIDGGDFGKAIDKMIRSARLVVVLWTEAATKSDWVLSEARLAVSLDKYQGVWLAEDHAAVDLLPVGLFDLQHHMFAKGLTDTAKARDLLDKIRTRIGPPVDAAGAAHISNTVTAEMTIYESVASLNKIEAYQGYIDAYPQGRFREDAEKEIKKLSSWRTRVKPYLPSLSLMSLAVGVAGLGVGYMQVPPETWELDAAKAKIKTLTQQVEEKGVAQTELTLAQESQRRAEAALASVIEDRDVAREDRDKYSDDLKEKENGLVAARKRVNDLLVEMAAATLKVKQLEQENADAKRSLDQAKAAADDTKSSSAEQLSSLRSVLAERDRSISTLKQELGESKDAVVQAKGELRELQRALAEAEVKAAELTEERDTAQQEIDILRPKDYVECLSGQTTGVEIAGQCYLKDIREISLHDKGRGALSDTDLAGLVQLQNLEKIEVRFKANDFSDVFSQLPNLRNISASGTKMADLDWVAHTPKLEALFVGYTDVTNIEPLLDLQHLKFLFLFGAKIKDLSGLKKLEKLDTVYFPNSTIVSGDELQRWKQE